MSSVDRQNKLIVAEDWKKIYQSFKNADFQSYDFDNLRRTMVGYLRENYPEDFNDYIESSEYLALIDLIAFLGQNLAFRFDLNSRDNFLELAERRESVLRLARLLSYNPKRNQPANGLLKFNSVSTTESIIDSNGRDLANRSIIWNDNTNSNWYEQFIKVINAALPENSRFGKPIDSANIAGVATSQYRFNATNSELPIYSFNKNIDGKNMVFEITSSSFKNSDKIYEEAPFPGTSLSFLYRDDGAGPPSSNTGFFAYFVQGTLQESLFNIARPGTNEVVEIDSPDINNNDIWLYSVDSVGTEETLWTKVDAVTGNSVIYNSVSKSVRKIYSVLTKAGDRARLVFADGVFGDLPQGNFKIYFRTSNGLSYTINPNNLKNVVIDIPYITKAGKQEALTISLNLTYSVNNSSPSETSDSIKQNAPATYYTQNRMITGEDYNVLPLSVNQEIIKVKSINRVSSGVSRYFDLTDASGKYSHTNLYGNDGIVYKQDSIESFTFEFSSRSDIENVVSNMIEPILASRNTRDFYYDKYSYIDLSGFGTVFNNQTSLTNSSTGYFSNIEGSVKIGSYTTSDLKFLVPGTLVRFLAPTGTLFTPRGTFAPIVSAPFGSLPYRWTRVINVVGDGTTKNNQVLDTGLGPVTFNDIIPQGAVLQYAIPKFSVTLIDSVRDRIVDSIFSNKNFGIRYDISDMQWKVISSANLNRLSTFSLGQAGNNSNQQLDSSWIILLETNGETYTVTSRGTKYIFESKQEVRFFYDGSDRVYDTATGKIIRDKITVLRTNTSPDPTIIYDAVNPSVAIGQGLLPLPADFEWKVVSEYLGANGYIDSKKICVSFYDSDDDGVIDNPEIFTSIVAPAVNTVNKFIFQQRKVGLDGIQDYFYIENINDLIKVYTAQNAINLNTIVDGQLVYIIEENSIKIFNKRTDSFIPTQDYRAFLGRDAIKFHYVHAADQSARIDPSSTNIMDVYILTKSYDTDYRRWLKGDITTKPLALSSDSLYTSFGSTLNSIKAISDEVIYHPVKYKTLFGSKADASLQATFKVVKNSALVISDSDIKTGIISATNEFFAIENWEFGDTFYFGELATYVMNRLSPNLVNLIIVPKQSGLSFGSLYEIKSNSDEIFISSASTEDIEIISEITAARIKADGSVITSTNTNTGIITSK